MHEVDGGRGCDGLVPVAADELAGCDAEGGGGALRGGEGEVVHGLEDGERLPEGNDQFEVGLDVFVNGGQVWAALSYGDPDGSTQWTAVMGAAKSGDEGTTVGMDKASSHGRREGKTSGSLR